MIVHHTIISHSNSSEGNETLAHCDMTSCSTWQSDSKSARVTAAGAYLHTLLGGLSESPPTVHVADVASWGQPGSETALT